MPTTLGSVVRCLRRLTAVQPHSEDDAALLARFAVERDETAFAALVRRHGPMVLATANRLLTDGHAAEDVFQATFLLLARKTPSLRGPGSQGGWLHGVAWRLAMKVRRQAGRRRRHEARTAPIPKESAANGSGGEPLATAAHRETRLLMHEELGRLPERYRLPLVLCYLEGLTNEEAAARIACPVGSVKSRLSRGRDLLQSRLIRRGLLLSAPALAVELAEASASAAAVSPELLNTTVRAAATFAAGQFIRDVGVSAGAAVLIQGTLRAMTMHKLKLTAATLALLVALAGFGTVFAPQAAVNEARGEEPPAAFTVPAETPQLKTDREAVVQGNTQFALDLYKKLAQDEKNQGKNLFLSPYSISTALAMTYVGARGETAAEMAKALRFPVGQERLHPAFAGLIGRFQANKKDQGYELSVANALWGQQGMGWEKDFLRDTQTNYGAGLRQVNFGDTEAARKTINGWVEEKTHDKIKDLLSKDALTVDTRLVLTNAIYFKGDWQTPFQKDLTMEEPFLGVGKTDPKADRGTGPKAPLMKRTGEFGYSETADFQVLELPYKGNALSMVVLLPRKVDGVADLEKGLTTTQLTDAIAKVRPRKVNVSLPKFKVTAGFELAKELKELGMDRAFGDGDFSGMTKEEHLHIAKVIHKAFVDVNEQGTEAAAATAVTMERATARLDEPPVAVFRADHPFLYLIRDNPTGSVLFLGRLSEPAK